MKTFEEMKALLLERSGKKLVAFSVIVFLLLTVIMFFTIFRFCGIINIRRMNEYLEEIPVILQSRRNELLMRSRVYEEDALARAELGLILYGEENELTDADKLEQIRGAVSADSISLLDKQGKLLSTTGPVSPEETFNTCIQALEPRRPHLEVYPALSNNGKKPGEDDGRYFVRIPVSGNTEDSLVFEFSCGTILELYNSLEDWPSVFERALSGEKASAYVRIGDELKGYPLDGLTDEQTSRLYEELTAVFRDSGSFWGTGIGRPVRFITLLGGHYLAMLMRYPKEDTDILLTLSLKDVIGNGLYIAASISAIIGFGMVLFQIYVFRRLLREKAGNDTDTVSRKWVCRLTWPGILTMLAVTALFSCMLLLLENRTISTYTAITMRMSAQHEIEARHGQERAIHNSFVDCYRTRAQLLADFLKEYPDHQTRAGLEELNRIAKTDYLMRFDSTGQEVLSSNSYTGFSADTNLGGDYQAVLLGYPYAVAGPKKDPYTGQMQIGTAVLMTDRDGLPDGFLLAVYNAGDLAAELERMSYESTVNSFDVQEGHVLAAVSDEDGCFIAHTVPEMIGQKAENSLGDYEHGSNYEGFTDYKGDPVCVSASSADGRMLLFIVPERVDPYAQAQSALTTLAVLLILVLLFYPTSGVLIARAMAEVEEKIQLHERTKAPMLAFPDGYAVFLTLFAIFAMIASSNGWWTTFDYVFSGLWSKGVHLVSIWAVLFILAVTLCFEYLIRTALIHLESRLSLRARTVTRLANSFVIYAVAIFLFFCIMSVFGANTTALLASAGVVSIAVGMGAQSMASDLLAGFFMMLEDSIHVGDQVKVSGVTGTVTDMGIRTTEITDENGNVVILNNSHVSPVCNMSKNHAQPEAENEPGTDSGKDPENEE